MNTRRSYVYPLYTLCSLLYLITVSWRPAFATTWIISGNGPSISQIAQVASPGDTLLLMHGTYRDQVLVNHSLTIASMYLFTHDSTDAILTTVTIPDSIRGDSTRSRSPFEIRDTPSFRLIGVTVENGLGTPFTFLTTPVPVGGAIFALQSNVFLKGCRIRTSTAERGGGVFAYQSNTRIEDSRIEFCWYDGASTGGGAYLNGDSIFVIRTLFNQNMLPRGSAGGIHINAVRYGEVFGSTFLQNTGGFGGGAGFLVGVKRIVNNQIIGNCSSMGGGFIITSGTGEFAFTDNWVMDNRAQLFNSSWSPGYGGVYFQVDDSSHWNILRNRFESNSSLSGVSLAHCGAVSFQGGSHILKNNYFLGNIGNNGAAVSTTAVVTNLSLDSNSFRNNHGNSTFYYLNHATCTIQNSDFIDNEQLAINPAYLDTIRAWHCYWGDPTGPRAAGNPNGLGDSLNTYVVFLPFRTTPVMPENQTSLQEGYAAAQPKSHGLLRAYPNPFNSVTTITYQIPHANEATRIAVFDALGRKVTTLWEGKGAPGERRFQWRPGLISSGNYFVRAESNNGGNSNVIRLQLIR